MHIENREQFEAWLDNKKPPNEICVALAARAALRVLPLAASAIPRSGSETEARLFSRLMEALFRASALALVASKYPARSNELTSSAAINSANSASSETTAESAKYAAAAAAYACDAIGYPYGDAAPIIRAVYASTRAAGPGADAHWVALSADATSSSAAPFYWRNLGYAPLWLKPGPPAHYERWERLVAALPEKEGWAVWIQWYKDLLSGASWAEAREIIFATVPDEKWAEGPTAANAWIAERLRELGPSPPAFISEPEAATVSTHTKKIFDLRLNRHGRLAPHWLPADESAKNQYGGFSIEDLYADARQACLDFADHALDDTAHNYMPRAVKRAAERLRDGLPPELAQTPPLSAERALAMALRAIEAAERDGNVAPHDMLFRHHQPELRGMYQRLAAIWPDLGDYREAARIDRFIEPDAEARRAQDYILATTAADTSVASPELQATLNETIATLQSAESDIPPGASEATRRRSLYDAMKSAAAQIAAIWNWTMDGANKVGKASGDAEAMIHNLGKLAGRLEKAGAYWDWLKEWWF